MGFLKKNTIKWFFDCFHGIAIIFLFQRMGNLAAILELDENLQKQYKVFEAAPQGAREYTRVKGEVPEYFL